MSITNKDKDLSQMDIDKKEYKIFDKILYKSSVTSEAKGFKEEIWQAKLI